MTEQKTSSPRVNASTDGHLSGEQLRSRMSATDRKKALELADEVGALWTQLCQNEPLMVELLLPEELRRKLGELARVTAS